MAGKQAGYFRLRNMLAKDFRRSARRCQHDGPNLITVAKAVGRSDTARKERKRGSNAA